MPIIRIRRHHFGPPLRILTALVIVGLALVWVMTQTDFGRNKLRIYGVNQLAERVHGRVSIGDVKGDLLSGARLIDVVITDSAGAPFLRADTIALRYAAGALFRKHLIFSDVRMVHAVVVFDQPPGQPWNVEKLFQGDTVITRNDTIPGFGDWVRLDDVTLVDGDVTVRREWKPPEGIEGDALAKAIEEALSPEHRELVERVPGGFQAISSFHDVNGHFPLIRFADPDSVSRVVDIDTLRMTALPFRPPAAEIRQMAGRLVITSDTIGFENVRVTLPASVLQVDGAYAFGGIIGVGIRVQGNPLALPDLRFLRPSLPEGGGKADLTISRSEGGTRLVARDLDLSVEGATLEGFADVESGKGGVRFRETNLQFAELDTRVVERLVPGLNVPVDAVLGGRLALGGTPDALDVDGFAEIRERGGATSRVYAEGRVLDAQGKATARDLKLRFDPLRLSLVEQAMGSVPIGGTVTGTATVNGGLGSVLSLDADLTHEDPTAGRSHVLARGGLRVQGGLEARDLALRLDPLQSRLVKLFDPAFPLGGIITGRAALDGPLTGRMDVDADLVHQQEGIGRSHMLAKGNLQMRGGLVPRGLQVEFDPLQSGVIRLFDGPPVTGTFAGRATLSGPLEGTFAVDADVTHAGEGGRSHVVAEGMMRLKGGFAARALRLRFDPLQAPLFRVMAWEGFKGDGELRGTATLDGTPATGLTAVLDATHNGSTGFSSVTGTVRGAFVNTLRSFTVDIQAHPLSLATVGLYAPTAGLRGSVTGPISARGTPTRADVNAAVDVAGGGRIEGQGTLGIGATAAYDFHTRVAAFDAGAITSRAPHTVLTGTIVARGVGTDPRTADATIDAALVDSKLGGAPRVDSTRVIARVANGLATFERGVVRLANARADLRGSFGLIAGRSGELTYKVQLDSLAQFRTLAPAVTAAVQPRPMVRERDHGRARRDSAQAVQQAVVQTIATGKPLGTSPRLDTIGPIPRDSIAGSLRAEGVLTGNVKSFDASGTAQLAKVVYNGSSVARGSLKYSATRAPTQHMSVDLDAQLAGVRAAGFAFDSATARVRHTGQAKVGNGRAELSIFQDGSRDYQLTADYRLALDRQELRLDDLTARFDSTRWTSRGPGTIRWAGSALELEHIDLVSDAGGHIFADGRLPASLSSTAPSDLHVSLERVQIADVAALVQDTLATRGLLTLDAVFRGTTRAPVVSGSLALDSASRGTQRVPTLRGTFQYAERELAANAQLYEGARQLATIDAHLPANLALVDRAGPLLLDGPISVDIQADSFPLESLPFTVPQVENLAGRVRGNVAIRGTRDDPQASGALQLLDGSVHVLANGVDLRSGYGAMRFEDDRMIIDSLVATSGRGPVRVSGEVELASLVNPRLNLTIRATDALLLGDERGDIKGTVLLYAVGPLNALSVTGEIHVASGVIDAPEPEKMTRAKRLDDPQLASVYASLGIPDALRPRSPFLESTTLDVWVWIDRDTWLRNTVMNVEIYTPADADALHVSIDPTTLEFVLEGVINSDRGDYTYAGREFKLTTGSVTFLPENGKDPILQLSARHEVPRRGREALTILIAITGSLSAPRLALSSNVEPPIPESDLLSYLAFGRESSQLLTGDGSGVVGDALGGLGMLAEQQLGALGLGALTQAFFTNIEAQGMQAGLDVFRIRPTALPDELNFAGYFKNLARTVDVEAGEYVRPGLFVAVQGPIGAGSYPGARVEYFTQRGFSWVTSMEQRFMPIAPTLEDVTADRVRVFGSIFQWSRRF